MKINYLTNIPLQDAQEAYLNRLIQEGFKSEEESISVMNSNGRLTSKAVYANISAPHYHASAMDGIVLNSKVTFGATETTPVILEADDYVVVDTGDPVPKDLDAVIMIEDIVEVGDGKLKIFAAATPWQHIRQIGEDICAGEMILPSFSKITPAAIGSMLAGGILDVSVIKKPVVGIIPTGDEIVLPTSNPKEGDIIEFNSSIFSAMLSDWGAEPVTYPICKDNFEEIKNALETALVDCDMVIINAGSSAGREDYTKDVIAEVGHVMYHGIAMKPGKPAILGHLHEKPILGAPGYPVSAIIVIEQLLKPLLEYYIKSHAPSYGYQEAILSRSMVSGLKYKEFVRVRMGYVEDKFIASPLNRGAGVVTSFMRADGILEVPQDVEGYEAGDKVNIRLLNPISKLEKSLVAIGSHDPLLDEVIDLIHISNNDLYMTSSHAGSMGGIMAVKRNEAHIAGIHLLDEATGAYNASYVKKFFPKGNVKLVECVGRDQGFLVQKGNPKNINSISDLYRDGIRYVNRQKGSGTRILFDYLNKTEEKDPSQIYGYGREEFTHTSVAAQIASDSADVGMGIYSAAKMFDLDFIPLTVETYDLLIPDYAWETNMVQELLHIIKGPEFRNRLEELKGYTIDNPGRIKDVL